MSLTDKTLKWVSILGKPQENTITTEDADFVDSLSTNDEVPLEIARATLLLDLALIDTKFDAREREFIINTLMYEQGMNEGEVENLIKTISPMIQFRGSHSMAVELQKRLGKSEREQIGLRLEQLIVADLHKDGFEIYLINKLKDLLGI